MDCPVPLLQRPSHILRSEEKYVLARIFAEDWHDRAEPETCLERLRAIARNLGVALVCDPEKPVDESMYVHPRNQRPAIVAGGAGDFRARCTAILHELGHHVLYLESRVRRDPIKNEQAAWEVAHRLAALYRLPLLSEVERQSLYSYRTGRLLEATSGSRRRRRMRHRRAPRSWRLEGSRRSGAVSVIKGIRSTGKKGCRYAKRAIKRGTVKRERRRAVPNLDE